MKTIKGGLKGLRSRMGRDDYDRIYYMRTCGITGKKRHLSQEALPIRTIHTDGPSITCPVDLDNIKVGETKWANRVITSLSKPESYVIQRSGRNFICIAG